MSSNKPIIDAVKAALSHSRVGTYEAARVPQDDEDLSALLLYAWNAEVSGSLLSPLHICEVVVRNAVDQALTAVYGARWPWSTSFLRSLPTAQRGYCQKRDLQNASRIHRTTGKVIPELKFVFWQKMFTGRHDTRIWGPHLRAIFPNADSQLSVAAIRQSIHDDLDQIRYLRNRIAHHEPIFNRNLQNDYSKIIALIEKRCLVTSQWLGSYQRAATVIASKP